jgi:putative transposase
VEEVRGKLGISERRVCRVLGQVGSVQRYRPKVADDEARLRQRIIALAAQYGHYGYRRITEELAKKECWRVSHSVWNGSGGRRA